jgi:hypothetical protein
MPVRCDPRDIAQEAVSVNDTDAPTLFPPTGQGHKAVNTPQPVKTGIIDKMEELKRVWKKRNLYKEQELLNKN